MKSSDTASWLISNHVAARTGIVMITHDSLAAAHFKAANVIHGGQIDRPLVALDIHPAATPDTVVEVACELVDAMNCREVLMLVDIYGSPTPCQIARRVCATLGARAEMISGVNMAMLLTAIEDWQADVHQLAAKVADCGRSSVLVGAPT